MLSTVTLGEIPPFPRRGYDRLGAENKTHRAKGGVRPRRECGKLPLNPVQGGMLNAGERERLAQAGIETAIYGEDRVAEERFIAYTACCCAKREADSQLFFEERAGRRTQRVGDNHFHPRAFPQVHQTDTLTADKIDLVEGKKPAFELTAALMRNGGELYESLENILKKDADYSGRLASLDSAAEGENLQDRQPRERDAPFRHEHEYLALAG